MENIIYYSQLAEDYYDASCSDHTFNGYDKNVLVDKMSGSCLFVPGSINAEEGQLIFRCNRKNGQTIINLKAAPYVAKKKVKTLQGELKTIYVDSLLEDGSKFEEEQVILPYELKEGTRLAFQVSNLPEFFESFTTDRETRQGAFSILANAEQQVIHEKCPPAYIASPYSGGGDVLFDFTHLEEQEDGTLIIVYRYDGSAS